MSSIITLAICYFLTPLLIVKSIKKQDEFLSVHQTTCLKGVAILIVILHHLSQKYDGLEFFFYQQIGYLGVAIFLFLSGYGLTESFKRSGLANFLRKRILKVYLPYVLATTTYFIYKLIIEDKLNINVEIQRIVGIDFSDWFVTFILLAYLLFYLSHSIGKKYALEILTLTITLYVSISMYFGQEKWWYVCAYTFPLGCLTANKKDQIISISNQYFKSSLTASIIIFITSTLTSYFYLKFYDSEIIAAILKIISATSFISIIIVFSIRVNISSKIFRVLGKYSYELYLSHIHIFFIVRNVDDSYLKLILFFSLSFLFMLYIERTSNFLFNKLK